MKQSINASWRQKITSTIMSFFGKSNDETVKALVTEMTYEDLLEAYISRWFDITVAESFAKRDVLKQRLQSKQGKEELIASKRKEEKRKQEEEQKMLEDKERYNSHVLSKEKSDEYMQQFLQIHELLQNAYLIDNRTSGQRSYDKIIFETMIRDKNIQVDILFDANFSTFEGNQVYKRRKWINYGIDAQNYSVKNYIDIEHSLMNKVYENVGLFAIGSLPSSGEIILDRVCLEQDGRGDVYGRVNKMKYVNANGNNRQEQYRWLYPEELVMLLIMDGTLTLENVKKKLEELMQKQLDDLQRTLDETDEKIKKLSGEIS